MNRIYRYLIVAVIASCSTAILYQPVALTFYRLYEPYFICPIKNGPEGLIVRNDGSGDGEFGAKRRGGRTHSGIDISAPLGTSVFAAKSGIAFPGNVPTGYGKYVMIYHPDGYVSLYGHLSDWTTTPTKKVRRGELIGFVGKTGNAAANSVQPHLHFEIRKEGEPVDPRPLMK